MSTLALINAIAQGSVMEAEQAFQDAMADKISAQLDAMRIDVAKTMFNPAQEAVVEEEVETISEEQYEALTEEEKAQYEIVEGVIKKIGNGLNKVADAAGDAGNAVGSLAGKAVGGVAKAVGAVRQAAPAAGAAYNKGRAGAQNAIAGK